MRSSFATAPIKSSKWRRPASTISPEKRSGSSSAEKPDGHMESQDNQLDANGQVQWLLWQYAKINNDKAWLEKVYPPCCGRPAGR